jgi:membrane-associated phospholipid phosphatase
MPPVWSGTGVAATRRGSALLAGARGGPALASQPVGRRDVRAAVVVAIVAAAAFVVVAVLAGLGWGPLVRLDRSVADGANGYAAAHPGYVAAMKIWTNVASPLVWRVLVVAVGVLLLLRRARRPAVFAIVAITAGGLLSTSIKVAAERTRPAVPPPSLNAAGTSFPSGHAATSAVACGVLLLLVLPRLDARRRPVAWVVAVAVPLTVGYTRIGLDAHWTSDVVAGWLLGIAVVAAAYATVTPTRRAAPSPTPAPGRSA